MISKEKPTREWWELFANRKDAYAVQRSGEYRRVNEPVTADLIQRHLAGEVTVALYQLDHDERVTWICWDLDGSPDHPEERLPDAQRLADYLKRMGLPPLVEFSGRKGYHVWLFINPTPAATAKRFADLVARRVGVRCEVFPKQTRLTGKALGNAVKLPLGLHRASGKRSQVLDTSGKALPVHEALRTLGGVQVAELPAIPDKVRPDVLNLFVEGVEEGRRDHARYVVAKDILDQGYTPAEVLNYLVSFNQRCKPPEAAQKVQSELDSLVQTFRTYPPISCSTLETKGLTEFCDKVCRQPTTKGNVDPKVTRTSFLDLPTLLAEMIWDKEHGSRFAVWNRGTGQVDYQVEVEGIRPFDGDLIRKGVILFPSTVLDYGDEKDLIEAVRCFVHTYVDVPEFYEKLATYYVLFTWIYDNFNTLPYLRALGDYGTGKTRFLQTVGSICYKPMFVSGATTASPVFRIIDRFNGTLVFDEADFRYSDLHAEITKILNCGYQKGFLVLRSGVSEADFETQAFDCYGPKLIATRRQFKDQALESRCLTTIMSETTRVDVPLLLTNKFCDEALQLRNKLLLFRFRHYGKVQALPEPPPGLEKRLSQIALSLLCIIDDPATRRRIQDFLLEYNRAMVEDRGATLPATVLEVIAANRDRTLYVKELARLVAEKIDDGQALTTQKLGRILKQRLFIPVVKDEKGRRVQIPANLDQLLIRYGLADVLTLQPLARGESLSPPRCGVDTPDNAAESPPPPTVVNKIEGERILQCYISPVDHDATGSALSPNGRSPREQCDAAEDHPLSPIETSEMEEMEKRQEFRDTANSWRGRVGWHKETWGDIEITGNELKSLLKGIVGESQFESWLNRRLELGQLQEISPGTFRIIL